MLSSEPTEVTLADIPEVILADIPEPDTRETELELIKEERLLKIDEYYLRYKFLHLITF